MSDTDQWPQGFRIMPRVAAIAADVVAGFRGVPTANASDCMGRATGATGLKPFHGSAMMCGPALTVRVRPGDNLMIHVALSLAEPGDVIVVDGAGDETQALMGGLMRTTCMVKKLGGLVIDGAIRDIVEFAEGGFACFAKSAVHRGPSKDGPGEINVPIACAGMVVHPGDLMLGDPDGVLCIPAAEAASVLVAAKAKGEQEEQIRRATLSGASEAAQFYDMLRKKGVPDSLLPRT